VELIRREHVDYIEYINVYIYIKYINVYIKYIHIYIHIIYIYICDMYMIYIYDIYIYMIYDIYIYISIKDLHRSKNICNILKHLRDVILLV
jgi:hypothetical protein